MWNRVRKVVFEACEVMEIFMAMVVGAGIVVAVVSLYPELIHYWDNRMAQGAFLEYLDAVFNVVIGIEFVKMLCKPSSANIMEVLIFLISRHMIIQATTAGQDLLSVISIGVLFFFRRFMLATKPDKDHHVPNLFGTVRSSRSSEVGETVMREDDEEDIIK